MNSSCFWVGFQRVPIMIDGFLMMALGSFMIASPAVVGDLLYVGTHDGEFLAVNWKKQEVVWRYSDPQKMLWRLFLLHPHKETLQ